MRLKLPFFVLCLLIIKVGFAQTEYLYGTTRNGGKHGGGTFYRIKSDGSEREVLYNFRLIPSIYPNSKFVNGEGSKVYGTSYFGGMYDNGTLYSYDLSKDEYKLLYEFRNDSIGREPIDFLYLYQDSLLIGSTLEGSRLYRYHIESKQIDLLHGLSRTNLGYKIHNAFEYKDKVLVSAYNNVGATVLLDYDFVSDSAQIFIYTDSLVLNQLVQLDDSIYIGTASIAQNNSPSTAPQSYIYQINGKTDSLSILYKLSNQIEGYWINQNLIIHDDSLLIGSCFAGGPNDRGTIFQYNILNNQLNVLNSTGAWYQRYIRNLIRISPHELLGSSFFGGAGEGLVFKYDLLRDTSYLVSRLDLDNTGGYPGNLIHALNQDTFLLVTSNGGGGLSAGTLLSYSKQSDSLRVELKFGSSMNGARPYANLIQMDSYIIGGSLVANKFFKWNSGLASARMEFSDETSVISSPLFRYDSLSFYSTPYIQPGGLTFIWKYDQDASFVGGTQLNGINRAIGNLFKHSDGKIYGIGNFGGAFNQGCIYEYNPASDQFSIIYDFGNVPNIGNNPLGNLAEDRQGNLIGIARKSDKSTIFKFNPINNAIDSISVIPADFQSLGSNPNLGFDIFKDSLLLGMYQANNLLNFFSFDFENGLYRLLGAVVVGDGMFYNYTRPVLGDSGLVYYSIFDYGQDKAGAIFKYNIKQDNFSLLIDFADSTWIYGSNPNEILIFDPFTTSVAEQRFNLENQLTVYPNPFSEQINLRSNRAIQQIVIYNMNGVEVYRRDNLNSMIFNLSPKLKKGVYLLRVIHEEGSVLRKIMQW
jgi:uncharacterized repeat protein (TIGR03803 family)